MKTEEEKYKEKIKKYKDKIKNKDEIIGKLLHKIEKGVVYEGAFDRLVVTLHQEYLRSYRNILSNAGEVSHD